MGRLLQRLSPLAAVALATSLSLCSACLAIVGAGMANFGRPALRHPNTALLQFLCLVVELGVVAALAWRVRSHKGFAWLLLLAPVAVGLVTYRLARVL